MKSRGLAVGALVALMGHGGAAHGQEFIKPGDSVILELPLENEAPSAATAQGVRVVATFEEVQPASLANFLSIDGPASVLGPLNIEAGAPNAQTFRVKVVVAAGANVDGTFKVRLHPTNENTELFTSPDAETLDTSVTFKIDRAPPDISVLADGGEPLQEDGYISLLPVFIDVDDKEGSGVKKVSVDAVDGSFHDEEEFDGNRVLALLGGGEDGPYVATAEDEDGNTATFQYRLDTTPPTITERIPAKDSVYRPEDLNGKIQVTVQDVGSGLDLSGVAELFAEVDGEPEQSVEVTQIGEGAYDIVFDFESFEFGEHFVQVEIADILGNIHSESWTFEVGIDGQFPVVTAREGQVTFPTSPISGAPTHFHWFHNRIDVGADIDGLDFVAEDAQSGLYFAQLKTEADDPLITVDFPRGRRTATIGGQVLPDAPKFPSDQGYRLSVADWYGATTTFRFGVDSVKPSVEYALHFDPNADVRAFGTAQDAGSGVDQIGLGFASSGEERGSASKNFNLIVSPWMNEASDITEPLHRLTISDASGLFNQDNPILVRRTFFVASALVNSNGTLVQGVNSESPLVVKRIIPTFSGNVSVTASDIVSYEANPPLENEVALLVPAEETSIFSGEVQQGVPIVVNKPIGVAARLRAIADLQDVHVGFEIAGAVVQGMRNMPMVNLNPGNNVIVEFPGVYYELPFVPPGSNWHVGVIPNVSADKPTVNGAQFRLIPGSDTKPFDLTTTGGVSGTAKFKVSYNPGRLDTATQAKLRLLRNSDGIWEDITTGVDVVQNVVLGETASNSIFGVFIATADVPPDVTPPITEALVTNEERTFESSEGVFYVSTEAFVTLRSTDDSSAVSAIFYAIDPSSTQLAFGLTRESARFFTRYRGPFSMPEGARTLVFGAADDEGNYEALKQQSALLDGTAPMAAVVPSGEFFAIEAVDPVFNGVASGVGAIQYLVDIEPISCEEMEVEESTAAAPGTCANLDYQGPFALAPGTHTVYFMAVDNVGNGSGVVQSSSVVVGMAAMFATLSPSTGPIGIPFTIAGGGFGAYAGANTKVLFGGTTAAISVWNDSQIKGTVPGLSSGTYAVTVFRQWPSSFSIRDVGPFEVTRLAPTAQSISSGPIGVPFTLTGLGFGPYAGANTRILIGGVAAPISVWNDAQIKGTVPAVSTGAMSLVIERAVGSFVSSSDPLPFEVTRPVVGAVTPSSAPIGAPFTLSGASFGPYAGSNTRVLFGGTTAAISVWNDSTIKGTVPGIATGTVTLIVERAVGAFTSASEARGFDVTRPLVAAVTPSSGPIGAVFTLSGSSFGPYAGANTRVLIDGTTTPISVWNDSTIKGTVPGALSPGLKELVVERIASNGVHVQSEPVLFQVAGLAPDPIVPSSGPIGIPFMVTGMDFGTYAGANTRVLFGGVTAAISVWNDTTIKGRVPALSTGAYPVVVERQQGAGVSSAFVSTFTLTELVAAALSPSSAPAGAPFTIDGAGFGPYAGAETRVLIGGTTAPISVWNDAQIKGTVPGVPAGVHELIIERAAGGSVQESAPAAFEVLSPFIASIDPSSGPIGIAFTLAGTGFGPYAGANTRVLIGGATTPISVWNDSTIKGTVPGALPVGLHAVVVQRETTDGWLSDSNTFYFQVTAMDVAELSPSSGPIGITFTLSGGPFGAYAGANTRVLIGGEAAAISVWNDSTIKGTVPALPSGTHELAVEREQGGYIASSTGVFTVADIVIAALSPSSGPIGAPVTLSGGSFGAYAGANTRLLIGGATAAVSVWNDATIKATIPALPEGLHPLWVERKSGSGVQSSATSYFQVLTPAVATLTPSSAPIGAPFILTGTGFGPYAGTNTRVLLGGVAAPISVWNDSTIKGTVPGALGPGSVELLVERVSGGGISRSATQAFEVLVPVISTLTPASGPTGTVITLSGAGFGPYGGSATRLLVGNSTAAVSVWNDRTIRGTVPGDLTDGEYPVVVERAPAGGTVRSASATFTLESGIGTNALFSAPLSAQPDQNFEGGLALAAADGGRVETPSKAAVEVPPAAMEEDAEITLRRVRDDDSHREEAAKVAKVRSAGEPIEFGPEGTRFTVPVVIELPYDPDALAVGVDQTKIAVHYYDPLKKAWEKLLSEVDVARKVVRARTDHFSLYQPMLPGIGTAAAQDEFSLRTAYVFPNPSRHSQAVTFRIQPGLADSVTVRVYDIAGRKVHESSSFTGPALLDDGNGLGAQQTYDHVWGVSGVGSGVYIYAITAKKAGQRDIVSKGKVGVIK